MARIGDCRACPASNLSLLNTVQIGCRVLRRNIHGTDNCKPWKPTISFKTRRKWRRPSASQILGPLPTSAAATTQRPSGLHGGAQQKPTWEIRTGSSSPSRLSLSQRSMGVADGSGGDTRLVYSGHQLVCITGPLKTHLMPFRPWLWQRRPHLCGCRPLGYPRVTMCVHPIGPCEFGFVSPLKEHGITEDIHPVEGSTLVLSKHQSLTSAAVAPVWLVRSR
jgi:hypothetical protein